MGQSPENEGLHARRVFFVKAYVKLALCRGIAPVLAAWLAVSAALPVEARTRKGEKLVKDGEKFEAQRDYEKALTFFEQALATDYTDPQYQLLVRRVRFLASQSRITAGQKLRAAGKMAEALAEFQKAFSLDPSSTMAEQEVRRTYQTMQKEQGGEVKAEDKGLTAAQISRRDIDDRMAALASAPELKPVSRQITNLKMNNQPARILFETVSKLAGLNVLFDPDFLSTLQGKNFTLDLTNSSIDEALDYLALLTKAYWKPISANAIFVTQDQQAKRREFEDNVVKVFYLQNVTAAQELNEIAAALRTITDIRRLLTYSSQMAIMVRGTTDAVTLAQKLIYDLDKPKAEVVIDVQVMEANRVKTRTLVASIANGATPGINIPIGFTPGGTPSTGGGTGTGTGTPTTSSSIRLSQLGKISTNDFSIALPGAILQALLSDRSTRVLQNPQLRTLDSQKASLKIGDRYPYATGSFQPGVGTIGVSPLVSTQFQFADVGVNVDVTPKIHSAEEVSMRVEIEVSNIRDQVDIGGLKQPVIGQRKIAQDIRLREGEASLIGGLTGLTNSKTVTGIPGLATMPGLGWLFGSQGSDINKNELLIVLTPRIVRSPDVNEVNLRTIAAGNDGTVKVTFQPKVDAAATPSVPGGANPAVPATVVPAVPVPGVSTPHPAIDNPPTPAAIIPNPAIPGLAPPQPIPSIAGGPQLLFVAPQATAKVGDLVTVTVEAINVQDLFSAPFRVNYDKNVLKLVEIVRGTLMGGDAQPVSFTRDVNSGMVRITKLPGTAGVTGSGGLVTLRFQALAKGTATVSADDILLQDSKLQPLNAAPRPVTVTVD